MKKLSLSILTCVGILASSMALADDNPPNAELDRVKRAIGSLPVFEDMSPLDVLTLSGRRADGLRRADNGAIFTRDRGMWTYLTDSDLCGPTLEAVEDAYAHYDPEPYWIDVKFRGLWIPDDYKDGNEEAWHLAYECSSEVSGFYWETVTLRCGETRHSDDWPFEIGSWWSSRSAWNCSYHTSYELENGSQTVYAAPVELLDYDDKSHYCGRQGSEYAVEISFNGPCLTATRALDEEGRLYTREFFRKSRNRWLPLWKAMDEVVEAIATESQRELFESLA